MWKHLSQMWTMQDFSPHTSEHAVHTSPSTGFSILFIIWLKVNFIVLVQTMLTGMLNIPLPSPNINKELIYRKKKKLAQSYFAYCFHFTVDYRIKSGGQKSVLPFSLILVLELKQQMSRLIYPSLYLHLKNLTGRGMNFISATYKATDLRCSKF